MRRAILILIIVFAMTEVKGQDNYQSDLRIKTSDGRAYDFKVELARSAKEKEIGLMFRKTLASKKGMLFLYENVKHQNMWMKNTFVPLVILFISENGGINLIHERAVPLSKEIISSRQPVSAVLEIRGGTVSKLRIQEGDIVEYSGIR